MIKKRQNTAHPESGALLGLICLARLEAVELNSRLVGDRVTLRDLEKTREVIT